MDHSFYLKECFRLAKLGESKTFPNPIVGAVIVYQGQIIASGFHRAYGEAHAERVAVDSLLASNPDAMTLMQKSTLYVSLEPCSHHGKTAPCSDLIIKHKFKTLVYAAADPNPLLSPKAITKIQDSGTEVIGPSQLDPYISEEAKFINRSFFKYIDARESNKKLWITLKIALTENAEMSPALNQDRYITNTASLKDVHRLRSTHDLLITGMNTVLLDNPFYNIRYPAEELGLHELRNPDLLILSHQQNLKDLDITNTKIFKTQDRKIFEIKLEKDFANLKDILVRLQDQGYKKILIEAGPTLAKEFLKQGLYDDLIVYSPGSDIEKLASDFFGQRLYSYRTETMIAEQNERNNLKAYLRLFC